MGINKERKRREGKRREREEKGETEEKKEAKEEIAESDIMDRDEFDEAVNVLESTYAEYLVACKEMEKERGIGKAAKELEPSTYWIF